MARLRELLEVLTLEHLEGTRWRARNLDTGTPVIFGGQVLAQAIVAATATQPDKTVKTIHTLFPRGGAVPDPVELEVDSMHAGRAFGSIRITFSQAGRVIASSLVLVHADEPDLIRHQIEAPSAPIPDNPIPLAHELKDWDIRIVDDVDVNDPDTVGPAQLRVWSRFEGAPDDTTTSQALLAYATDGFLIGTAMLPHAGVGQAQSHRTISTSVVSHTLTFHEPFHAGQWLLIDNECSYTGRGRAYGGGHVFDESGALVASYVQDDMIRHYPEGQRSGL